MASEAEVVKSAAVPLDTGLEDDDVDRILEGVGDVRLVLIGEASHGTAEFYRIRAAISRRLIEEWGFCGVVAEADWPDAYRVNRWLKGGSEDRTSEDALGDFRRFPTWMWRNTAVRDFLDWLKKAQLGRHVGFYGMDLYSMRSSMEAVLEYLDRVDPKAAARARYRYACFDQAGEDEQAYGYAAGFGLTETCQEEVVQQLVDLQRSAAEGLRREGRGDPDEEFFAEQNARLVKNAEEYYRTMFRGHVESWNIRDSHMVETLEALANHLAERETADGGVDGVRLVVWAHNSHLGDARATEMGARGEHNVGQLVRERHGSAAHLLGFTTYTGHVTAAAGWDSPAEQRWVRPGLTDGYESLFHEVPHDRFFVDLREGAADEELRSELRSSRLERAIGVVYAPQTERISHYFDARLAEQFDGVIHIDETSALEPLDRVAGWDEREPPETYPFGV